MQAEVQFREYLGTIAQTALPYCEATARHVVDQVSQLLDGYDRFELRSYDEHCAILQNGEDAIVKLVPRDGVIAIDPRYSYAPPRHQGDMKIKLGQIAAGRSGLARLYDGASRCTAFRSSGAIMRRLLSAAWDMGLVDQRGLLEHVLNERLPVSVEKAWLAAAAANDFSGIGFDQVAEFASDKTVKTAISQIKPIGQFFVTAHQASTRRVNDGALQAVMLGLFVLVSAALTHAVAHLVWDARAVSFVSLFVSFVLGLAGYDVLGERWSRRWRRPSLPDANTADAADAVCCGAVASTGGAGGQGLASARPGGGARSGAVGSGPTSAAAPGGAVGPGPGRPQRAQSEEVGEWGESRAGASTFVLAAALNVGLHLSLLSLHVYDGAPVAVLASCLFFIYPINYFANLLWAARPGVSRIITRRKLVNHRYYASTPLVGDWAAGATLPVTISVPVYTEDNQVLFETFRQALAAIRDYSARTGQAANLVVSDDGLARLLPDFADGGIERVLASRPQDDAERQAAERIRFYRANGIGFVARPWEGRRGLFKKAGNMNYTLRLGEALAAVPPAPETAQNTPCLAPGVLAGRTEPVGRGLQELLAGEFAGGYAEGDVTTHDLILLLDKDSQLASGVIAATVPEFTTDPKLVYTQHQTKPTNADTNFFARIMGAFTVNLFANGLPAKSLQGFMVPLVGHNAFLRRSFLKETGWWPEDRVSEDYAKSMDAYRLGYHGKYLAFTGLDFGEYVSETFTVETSKQYRYAFGLLEIMFNTPNRWLRAGVFNREFRHLVRTYPRARIADLYDMVTYFFSFMNSAVAIPTALVIIALGNSEMLWGGFFANFLIFAVIPSLNILTNELRRGRLDLRTAVSFVAIGPVFLGHTYSVAKGFAKFFADGFRRTPRGFAATDVDSYRYFGDGLRILSGYYRQNKSLVFAAAALVTSGGWSLAQAHGLTMTTVSVGYMMMLPVVPIVMTPALFRPPRWAARLVGSLRPPTPRHSRGLAPDPLAEPTLAR
jgi:cellulose synthase/poly-beta-1,6-N-acetylglucosamine synthase-like glycosyltransferase